MVPEFCCRNLDVADGPNAWKMAILVLPYVSICAEKAEHLEVLLEPLGKHVRSYYGSQGGATLPKDTSVAVCTIEKANSLFNRFLEEDRLSEVGIIVIDELHMLRYAAGEGNIQSSSGESSGTSSSKSDYPRGMQIVGMSATMPNVAAVAEWLHAALYQTEFRPVPLEEYIKVGSRCEFTARHVSKYLKKFSAEVQDEQSDFVNVSAAIDALWRSPVGLDPTLEETLPSGVAYHHAGLTMAGRAGRTGIDEKGESVVMDYLSRAREGFILASDLHILAIVLEF
ncbi:hypothetical protein V2J09_012270 [Rumex salicifolius]